MQLGILTTARCNARCQHCSTSCGPDRRERLTREEIVHLMDQAAALADGAPLKFSLSGGEVFLDFELLLDVIAHGARLGAEVTCVTNGYWATSHEKARAKLLALKTAGLKRFSVSSSRFHEQFVPRRRVETVLRVACEIGLPCSVKLAHSATDASRLEAFDSWATAAGADRVQELPLMPFLRGNEELPALEYPRARGLPDGPCPAPVITVTEDGQAWGCCTPGAFVAPLRLGDARTQTLAEIEQRFLLGGVQRTLHEQGPIVFARELQARGLGQRLRRTYGGICDLCTHLVNDPVLTAAVSAIADAREALQFKELVTHAVLRRSHGKERKST